jgi:diacylglycerol kinase
MFSLKKVIRSFRHAFRGAVQVAKEEQSFRIELLAAAVVVFLMFLLDLSTLERAILGLVIVLVLILELVNSVFERVADMLKPRFHQYVEDIKDIMAATVLVSAVGSVVIGLLIFWPHLVK